MTCPRNLTKEQIIAGLQSGKTLIMDRRDAPEFVDLLELERQGLVTQEFVEIDEQSSCIKWRWVEYERGLASEKAMTKSIPDIAFEYGIRFHVFTPTWPIEKNEIMVAWEVPKTSDEPCAAIISTNEPWPPQVPLDRITAVFLKSKIDLPDALAFIAVNKGKPLC